MITRQDAKEATGLDKKFLLAAIALQLDVQELLDDLSDNMIKTTLDYAQGDTVRDESALADALAVLIGGFMLLYADQISAAVKKIAQYKVDEATDLLPKLRASGAHESATKLRIELNNYADDVGKAYRYRRTGDKDFNERIKTVHEGSEKTVRNIVYNGVNKGKSAKQIAKDIEQYVNPVPGSTKAKPFDIYRERFGKPKNFTPKGVNPGTIQYNALRIARTESAEVYRRATDDFYSDKEYIKEKKWVLSATHAHKDVCDNLAARKYKREDQRPYSHPHCLCDWIAVPYTMAELRTKVKRGDVE